jgi:ankyrin repeat protein
MMGHSEMFALLIEHQADLNLQTIPKKYSVLHLSMMAGRLDQAIEFIKFGADPLLEDYQGNTLLDMVYKNNPDRVEQL